MCTGKISDNGCDCQGPLAAVMTRADHAESIAASHVFTRSHDAELDPQLGHQAPARLVDKDNDGAPPSSTPRDLEPRQEIIKNE
jgi:hypothetical protein